MRIQQVEVLTGLTRGQINQLISRYGVLVHGGHKPGSARDFTPADVFGFCIAGRAAALGVNMPTIRWIVASLPMPVVDPSTFHQREIFPGYRRDRELLLVVTESEGNFNSHFVSPDKVHLAVAKDAEAALVFPASKIAREIEDFRT